MSKIISFFHFSNYRNSGPSANESYRGYPGYQSPQQGPRPTFQQQQQQQQPSQQPAASSTPPHSQPPIMPPSSSSTVPPVTVSSPQTVSASPVANNNSQPSAAQSGIPTSSVPQNYPASGPPNQNQPDFYNRSDQVRFFNFLSVQKFDFKNIENMHN